MSDSIPENIKALLAKHKLYTADAAWELPQKKGCWILKHKIIEKLVAVEGITFELPQTIFVDADSAVVLVHGKRKLPPISMQSLDTKTTMALPEQYVTEWSYGEASPKNNKNAYPVAMAEKRAKDRVALKLLGLHGDAYSEDESDDFKEVETGISQFGFANAVTRNEYYELLAHALRSVNSISQLEEMKPYFARLSKTDEQIKIELTARYLELQDIFKRHQQQLGEAA